MFYLVKQQTIIAINRIIGIVHAYVIAIVATMQINAIVSITPIMLKTALIIAHNALKGQVSIPITLQ